MTFEVFYQTNQLVHGKVDKMITFLERMIACGSHFANDISPPDFEYYHSSGIELGGELVYL
jgi:hypothetical protein